MLNRRAFVKAAGLAAISPSACIPRPVTGTGALVNDIHSELNATWVSSIVTPRASSELVQAIRSSRSGPICVAGGRHAMGGQQFAHDATLIDIRQMSRILTFDSGAGIVEVESGIQWPELVAGLTERQRGAAKQWGIRQKQTGADRLTIGGGLAANVHGRGLTMRPFIDDIESFVLVTPDGESLECSRTRNRELFSLVIGGYGLFGVISTVRLRLSPRRKVQRVVEVQQVETVAAAFERRIEEGFLYGDFQFSINDQADHFLRSGVFSCYRPVADDAPIDPAQAELRPEDWLGLLHLAHADKEQAYQRYVGYYLSTTGQVYWSDEHQLSYYPDHYHHGLDQMAKATTPAREMISELYVPRPRLADFMAAAAEELRRRKVPVVYGTVRLIEPDQESFLPWAGQRYACVIFNLHTEHSDEGKSKAADAFRSLIDLALERDGSYYLTYHRWARRDQVERAYPRFARFLQLKQQYDPRERMQSEWYRHYREMFRT